MSSYLIPEKVLRVAAAVFVMLAAAVAVIQSRRGEDAAVLASVERGEADSLVDELPRCRTVTSDDTAGLDACHRIWAENPSAFLRLDEIVAVASPGCGQCAPAELMKSQERVPPHEVDQGRTR